MKPEEIKQLAEQSGIHLSRYGGCECEIYELEAYTAAVESPLQARIAQLEEALNELLSHNTIDFGDREKARESIYASPSTWLSEHDKAVEARERERCALIADIQPHANSIASRIRELT